MGTEDSAVASPPIPVNGNGRVLKTVWVVLGFISITVAGSFGAWSYLSGNFVPREIYENDKRVLSDNIRTLNTNIEVLTTAINSLNSKLSYLEGRASK